MNTSHRLRTFQVTSLAFALLIGGCRAKGKEPGGTNVHVDNSAPASSLSPKSIVDESADHGGLLASDAQAHDPAHPPIDCPLHKLGVDPMHLRPFDDVEKYITFLEKPERVIWQKPDDVVAALGLKGSETLIDVGAGSGYFTFRFAKVLPHGKVIAADTEAEMIRHIHHKVMSDGITNIQAVLIKPEDPQVTKDADWVFICDVLHHVPDRPVWLGRIASAMKSGAKLALIEFKEGKLPEGPPESAKIPRAQLVTLANQAGLKLDSEKLSILPYQVFLVFGKP